MRSLEQTLDFFDIETTSLSVRENAVKIEPNANDDDKNEKHQMDSDSNDGFEIIENQIKLETVELVSTSNSDSSDIQTDATQPMTYERVNYRPSLDSTIDISDHRSTCSPSTSNQPMLSPVETPDSTPNLSPDFNREHIKREPIRMEYQVKTFARDECVVKMEDVPMDSAEVSKRNRVSSCRIDFNRSVSQMSEPMPMPMPLKRQPSVDVQNGEISKRLRTTEEQQTRGSKHISFRSGFIAFQCFVSSFSIFLRFCYPFYFFYFCCYFS